MIKTEVVPDDLAFIVHVRASKPVAAKDWQKIFDDLDRAMDEIEAKLTDHDTDCFQIRLVVDGFNSRRLLVFEEGGEYTDSSNDPWDGYSPDFWRSALADPALRPRVEQWVIRYVKALKCGEMAARSTSSLWEDDHTQFGEPLMMLLAIQDIAFVAQYQKFLELWDLDHQVEIWTAVEGIIQQHGKRRETAALRKLLAKQVQEC
jgi:hypothetical protein